jgi:hypothetical protein
MVKARDKKGKEFQDLGMTSSFSILNSFEPLHFDELSAACGVWIGDNEMKKNEMISTLVAQEKAQAMLAEARVRKEKEKCENMDKEKQLIIREDQDDERLEGDEERGAC